jgi:hypothetical protein
MEISTRRLPSAGSRLRRLSMMLLLGLSLAPASLRAEGATALAGRRPSKSSWSASSTSS